MNKLNNTESAQLWSSGITGHNKHIVFRQLSNDSQESLAILKNHYSLVLALSAKFDRAKNYLVI